MEDIKIIISALWISRMLTGFLGDVLRFLEPGLLEQIIAGETGGMQLTNDLLLVSAIIMVLPIIMVFLTLILKDKLNRILNVVLAIFLFIFDLTGLFTYTFAYSVFLIIVGMVFCVLIIWYAWKWPVQKNSTN